MERVGDLDIDPGVHLHRCVQPVQHGSRLHHPDRSRDRARALFGGVLHRLQPQPFQPVAPQVAEFGSFRLREGAAPGLHGTVRVLAVRVARPPGRPAPTTGHRSRSRHARSARSRSIWAGSNSMVTTSPPRQNYAQFCTQPTSNPNTSARATAAAARSPFLDAFAASGQPPTRSMRLPGGALAGAYRPPKRPSH